MNTKTDRDICADVHEMISSYFIIIISSFSVYCIIV